VSEQAIAETVVAYLEALGADVYQEVTVPGGVADIVARVHHEAWIVEVKTSLSLALIAQAMLRRRQASRVYIAAPWTRNGRDVASVCKELGLGMFVVRDLASYRGQELVTEEVAAARWNRRPTALLDRLCPEHKTHAKAGAVGAGGRWTPYLNTIEQLRAAVHRSPGITLKSCIDEIKHHYSSPSCARSSLAKWIEAGKVPGIRIDTTTKPAALYPTEVRS
jgi:hypothetical protein